MEKIEIKHGSKGNVVRKYCLQNYHEVPVGDQACPFCAAVEFHEEYENHHLLGAEINPKDALHEVRA